MAKELVVGKTYFLSSGSLEDAYPSDTLQNEFDEVSDGSDEVLSFYEFKLVRKFTGQEKTETIFKVVDPKPVKSPVKKTPAKKKS